MTASGKHQHRKHESCARNEHYRYTAVRNVCLVVSTWTKDSNSGVFIGKLRYNNAIMKVTGICNKTITLKVQFRV